MKKFLLSSLGLIAGFSATAQLPVSTAAENKNVILEEFTGIACTYCPDGHKRGAELAADNPGDVFLINIHTGGYATPQGAGTDFRTSFGDAIAGQTDLTGYPAGTVNRHVFASAMTAGGTAMGRGDWADAAENTILTQASYVNVACEGTIDATTRELTVDVEVHFTGVAPASVNLNVALTQDDIEGPQTGSAFNPTSVLPNGNYNHGHMLRHMLTGQWGTVITTTTQGTTFSQSYTYTLPADINDVDMELGKFNIVAFIAEGQQEIISGNDGPITYTNLLTNNAAATNVTSYDEICGTSVVPSITIQNVGDNAMTAATITYDVAGQNSMTFPWTGNLATFESEDITLPAITVPAAGGAINVTITDVNAGADANTADNTIASSNVSISTLTTTGTDYVVTINQDRYGSETTWEIVDGSGTSVATGGPYADLSANGTQEHTHNVTLPSTGCYALTVFDSYGDGINSGYGAGSYSLMNNANDSYITSNGSFSSEDRTPFELANTAAESAGLTATDVINDVVIYPNPVGNTANVVFNLTDNTNSKLEIYNAVGQLVYTQENLTEGVNTITFDATALSNGLYYVTISTENGSVTEKITVLK